MLVSKILEENQDEKLMLGIFFEYLPESGDNRVDFTTESAASINLIFGSLTS